VQCGYSRRWAHAIPWLTVECCVRAWIARVQKCPFEAIEIINLPKSLGKDTTHRYGPNSFKLHRLPMPRPGQVLGLVGTNGIGTSTAACVHIRSHRKAGHRMDSPTPF
jgi:ATP-binding cassette subfamily E protein 1